MHRPMLSLALATVGFAAAAAPSFGILNEFSVSDGYMGAFSTPVWTYHPNWSFVSGNSGSNYVSQHGYGSGFALTEPFGLVFRNDNGGSNNWRLRYGFDPGDLGGANPSNLAGNFVTITFDVNGYFGSGNSVAAPMLVMGFGGTASAPGFRIAISNNTRWMTSDPSNNLVESPVAYMTYWNRMSLNIDFVNQTYDLGMYACTGNPLNASNTWNAVTYYPIVTGAPFANPMTSMNDLWWDINTDPNGGGFGKNFFDHFTGRAVPAPGCVALGAVGALVVGARRRRARG